MAILQAQLFCLCVLRALGPGYGIYYTSAVVSFGFIDEMFAGEVGIEGSIDLHGFDGLLYVVVITVHGIEFFIDHEMSGSKLVMYVFGVGL